MAGLLASITFSKTSHKRNDPMCCLTKGGKASTILFGHESLLWVVSQNKFAYVNNPENILRVW